MRRYVLKKNNLYLTNIEVSNYDIDNISFDKEYRLLYDDIEMAYYDKLLIKNDLGIELNVEICKEVENEIQSINE